MSYASNPHDQLEEDMREAELLATEKSDGELSILESTVQLWLVGRYNWLLFKRRGSETALEIMATTSFPKQCYELHR